MIWFRTLYYRISGKIKCMLGKHYSIQIIDDASLDYITETERGLEARATINNSHFECRRCKKPLEFGMGPFFDQRKKDGDNS